MGLETAAIIAAAAAAIPALYGVGKDIFGPGQSDIDAAGQGKIANMQQAGRAFGAYRPDQADARMKGMAQQLSAFKGAGNMMSAMYGAPPDAGGTYTPGGGGYRTPVLEPPPIRPDSPRVPMPPPMGPDVRTPDTTPPPVTPDHPRIPIPPPPPPDGDTRIPDPTGPGPIGPGSPRVPLPPPPIIVPPPMRPKDPGKPWDDPPTQTPPPWVPPGGSTELVGQPSMATLLARQGRY